MLFMPAAHAVYSQPDRLCKCAHTRVGEPGSRRAHKKKTPCEQKIILLIRALRTFSILVSSIGCRLNFKRQTYKKAHKMHVQLMFQDSGMSLTALLTV